MKNFNIYNPDLTRIGEISTFISSVWSEGYNTVGNFQLEVQKKTGLLALLQIGYYVGKNDKKTLMIIKSVQTFRNKIIVNGFPAVQIFNDRVSTEIVSNETAETALRRVVGNMTEWDNIELGEPAEIEDVFPRQFSQDSVLNYCLAICQEIDAGFILRHDKKTKKLLFEIYKPTDDKNLKFAEKFGNLTDSTVSFSENNFKNVAIVAGMGEGESRIFVTVGATETTGLNRREIFLDARHIQQEQDETETDYLARLENYGLEQLSQMLKTQNVKISVNPDDFGTKFVLGDNITCILTDFGLKLRVKIVQFTETIQKNGTSLEISVGNPIILNKRSVK